jgi:uncharacterized phage-associated protein
MKVLKLVYYGHGWYLAIADSALIDEAVEAWQWGPVIPSIYRAFKEYGNSKITGYGSRTRFIRGSGSVDETPHLETNDSRVVNLLDKIWSIYGKYTPIQLSNMTHDPEGPWAKAVNSCQKKYGHLMTHTEIPQDSIRDYFRCLKEKQGQGSK